jgi:hypothetical protein
MASGLKPNWSDKNCAHEIQTHIFYSALAVEALYPRMAVAVEALYPRMAVVPPIRTIFSLTRLVEADV